MVAKSGIAPNQKCNQITKEAQPSICGAVKRIQRDFHTRDSVLLRKQLLLLAVYLSKRLTPKTMESKLVNGLVLCGEVIDVDAYTGGFNLQIAFSTGVLAAHHSLASMGHIERLC